MKDFDSYRRQHEVAEKKVVHITSDAGRKAAEARLVGWRYRSGRDRLRSARGLDEAFAVYLNQQERHQAPPDPPRFIW